MIKLVDYAALGKRIKQLRRAQHLTQEQLGERAGYSKSFIGCVENHSSIPSIETIVKISCALGVTPDYFLLGIKSDMERYQRIAEKLSLCAPEDQETIEIFIDALLERRPYQPTK